MGLICDIERLQKYTVELRIRNGESSKVIQNGMEQVMDSKKLVERDLQAYSREFNTPYALRMDYTYNQANEMLEAADAQVKTSLRIVHQQIENECLKRQVQSRAPKKQFMS